VTAIQELGARRVERQVSQLGASGFFVEDQGTRAQTGELVVMEFAVAEQGPLRVTGEVAHVEDGGFGVRVTRADWARLSLLLEQLG
jgi:hypothetical protein